MIVDDASNPERILSPLSLAYTTRIELKTHVLVVQLERAAANIAGNKTNVRAKGKKDPFALTDLGEIAVYGG